MQHRFRIRARRGLALAAAASVVVACSESAVSPPRDSDTSTSEGAPQDGGGDEVAEPNRPHVTSIVPADGATGVEADAAIVITFSAPMNRRSVDAALTSPSLPPLTFTWAETDTVLTLTPGAGLAYATGGDTTTPPKATI